MLRILTTTLQCLHFISCEKFPLTQVDLIAAHARWPELAPWAEQLQQQWPSTLPGCQHMLFSQGKVTLDLWLGDINALIHTFDDSLHAQIYAWSLMKPIGYSPRQRRGKPKITSREDLGKRL